MDSLYNRFLKNVFNVLFCNRKRQLSINVKIERKRPLRLRKIRAIYFQRSLENVEL